ncbi:putative low molecular weight phosphotyrosine protein phosphatase [Paratrimastix pyriformis]|uniref:Low molecular weight phosphotyrosine protein phosphatase n=1 Tax=Paratrimastix pyriformis TaxID=342808 RepID=A0ABQ8URQ8_9EUKA|nr:putative low molecular weight phosphotyrosine protein phosphatase [Paratrimastix pyriformis]
MTGGQLSGAFVAFGGHLGPQEQLPGAWEDCSTCPQAQNELKIGKGFARTAGGIPAISCPMTKVMFVCTGNICRSPTAEGVARKMVSDRGLGQIVEVASSGMISFHRGEAPDPRTQKAARKRGYDISRQRARHIDPMDFEEFDLLLALDRSHLQEMKEMCPREHQHKLHLLMEYGRDGSNRGADVPDPYYGGPQGFDLVVSMVEEGVRGLLDAIAAGSMAPIRW